MNEVQQWAVADSAWWGPGQWFGRCALRLRGDGTPADPAPVAADHVPAGARAWRVPGTLLPGLRDAHVHSGLVDLREVRAAGITEVHDLGSAPEVLAAHAHRPEMPRMRAVGAFLTAPGGYPSGRSWARPGSYREVVSAADAEVAVAEQREVGACAIKVALNADAGAVLPERVLASLVRTAHEAHLPVIAHAEGTGTARLALDIGVDRLAHTPWTERLDDGLVAELAGATTWISTLDIHGYGTDTPELRTAVDNLRRFVERGGSVRYGTDLGNGPLPPGVNPREITALRSAGLAPDDVLAAMADPRSGNTPCWVPGGLDRAPEDFAESLSAARPLNDPR